MSDVTLGKAVLGRTGSWYARRSFKRGRKAGKESEEGGLLPIKRISDTVGSVHISLDLTLNLGDFSSASVGAGITLPADEAGADVIYAMARKFVQERIREQVAKAKARHANEPLPSFALPELEGWDEIEFVEEEGPPARCSVSVPVGQRVNMQNYESAKVSVVRTVRCHAEEIGDAWTAAAEFAEHKLAAEVAEILPKEAGPAT